MNEISIIVAVALIVAGLVFWPRRGLLQLWRIQRRTSSRIIVEDALKHVYNCEYGRIACTIESLAGALSISKDRAAELLGSLTAMRLVILEREEFRPTDEGRDYALRIIRMHRLWERHLADETTVNELEWHPRAEKQEHILSRDEADALARRLGQPPYDPHGDPIPSVSGTIPMLKGKPLHAFNVGDAIKVLHVEDEPAAVYAQVLRYGLFPGMTAMVLHRTPGLIRIESEGKTMEIPTIVAANIRGVPLSKKEVHRGARRTLAALGLGASAVVEGISLACRGQQRRRLMDLGVVPGSVIEAEMRSASGDPTSYKICGASIALRQKQAEMIYLEEERKL